MHGVGQLGGRVRPQLLVLTAGTSSFNLVHSYTVEGPQAISLIVRDTDGLVATQQLAIVVSRPALTLTAPGDQPLHLSWPAAALGYELESTDNPGPSAVWLPVAGTVVVGDQNVASVPQGSVVKIFRLHKL